MSKKQEAHLRMIGYKEYHHAHKYKFYTNRIHPQDIQLNTELNLAISIFPCEETEELLKLLNYELNE